MGNDRLPKWWLLWIVAGMVIALSSCKSEGYVIERGDTLIWEVTDTVREYVKITERDTLREVHNYYYTIREKGDTSVNETHYVYASRDRSDSTEYYKGLYEKEKAKSEVKTTERWSSSAQQTNTLRRWKWVGLLAIMLALLLIGIAVAKKLER